MDPSGNTIWDILDFLSFGDSLYTFFSEPSWFNAGMLAWDTAALLPIIPSSGSVKIADKVIDLASEAHSASRFEKLKAALSKEELLSANPVGSALKEDVEHSAARWAQNFADEGRQFSHRGDDGRWYNLTQTPGSLNGRSGIFEWLVDSNNNLTHQRFIDGGIITGFPNQNPRKLP